MNYFRIAWQSAFAAGLCLGLPAGLLFWLILANEANHSPFVEWVIGLIRANGLNNVFIEVAGSLFWSFLLGRISGYRSWWRIQAASALGILLAWFSPFSNIDGILYDYRPATPIHVIYAVSMVGLIGSVTAFVGLGYGLILKSAKAALTMALTTSIVSVLALLLTIVLFDQFGIRVGTADFAMSKVTSVSLMMSAIVGGTVLGVGFSWFVFDDFQMKENH